MESKYIVFLRAPLEPQLEELLDGYLEEEFLQRYVYCSTWENNGAFVYMKALTKNHDKEWGINIPVGSIYAIADFSKEKKIGFLSEN